MKMDIYRGDDLTLQIAGLPSGAKAVEAIVMTDGTAQLTASVSGGALHLEAADLAKLSSGVICYALRYYSDDAAYSDGRYNSTAVIATDYYLRDCQQNGGDISLADLKKQVEAALKELQGGGGGGITSLGYPIEAVSGDNLVLSAIYPNKYYKAATVDAVSVDTIFYSDGTSGSDFSAHGGVADEYVLDFVAGASCNVSLPAALKWAFTPSFDEGKRYVISIVDNLAIAAEFNGE